MRFNGKTMFFNPKVYAGLIYTEKEPDQKTVECEDDDKVILKCISCCYKAKPYL